MDIGQEVGKMLILFFDLMFFFLLVKNYHRLFMLVFSLSFFYCVTVLL